jgi:NhaA family Na+:H+ antiporter
MATDIAFALGVLSLLGKRVPLGLKVFLTALAIVDDLGAIIVLAIFYPTHALHFDMLLYAAIVVLLLFILNRNKENNPVLYLIPGLFLWYFIFQSGIHATIAGVILALTIPSKTVINEVRFSVSTKYWLDKFKQVSNSEVEVLANPEQQHILYQMEKNVKNMSPLMHKFEAGLHPLVTFFIMPVFALANAGVAISGDLFTIPVPSVATGIFFGLLCGKPLGIFLFSLAAVKMRIAELPQGTNWKQIFALGIIAGIGFALTAFPPIPTRLRSVLTANLREQLRTLAIRFSSRKTVCTRYTATIPLIIRCLRRRVAVCRRAALAVLPS